MLSSGTWIGTISLSGTNILFVYRYYPELAPAFRLAYLPIQVNLFHYMLLTLCLSTGPVKHRVREASHIDFVQEKRHLVFFWRPPLLGENVTHFFRLFILQALRLSVVYKGIKVHLKQSQELIMSIYMYFKCKYTYENAGLGILCADNFKILKIFIKLSKFSMIFTEKHHRRQPPTQRA